MQYSSETPWSSAFARLADDFVNCLLEAAGDANLPNPQGHRHGVLSNLRLWDWLHIARCILNSPRGNVLDTGAFFTFGDLWLAQYVAQVVATDNFYWCRRTCYSSIGLSDPKIWADFLTSRRANIRVEHADVQSLHYPTNYFDFVLSISTIEHVLDDNKAMQEMYRVLKPGGELLLTTEFNPGWAKVYSESDGSWYRVYDTSGVERLIKAAPFVVSNPLYSHHQNPPIGKFTTLFMRLVK